MGTLVGDVETYVVLPKLQMEIENTITTKLDLKSRLDLDRQSSKVTKEKFN